MSWSVLGEVGVGRVLSRFPWSQSQAHGCPCAGSLARAAEVLEGGSDPTVLGGAQCGPCAALPAAVGGGTPWVQPQCPQERGETEQSHNESVPPCLIQGLPPFVAQPLPRGFPGPSSHMPGPCFSLPPTGFSALGHLHLPSILPHLPGGPGAFTALCPGARFPLCFLGQEQPILPQAQPRILRENNKSVNWEQNSARDGKGFNPWLALERKAASRPWLTGSSCLEEAHGI